MIRNERAYWITKAQALKFRASMRQLRRAKRPEDIQPRLWEAQRAGMESQLADLEKELREYERLRSGKRKVLELNSLDALPLALIQARIAAGLTQEDLATRLGVNAQQIQRYEATEYRTASFDRIREVVRALGVKIRERVELAQR